MSIEVEIHPDVTWFLERRCTPEERREFWRRLQEVEREPIKRSTLAVVPELSRYALRCFGFGINNAIFLLDAARNRIYVLRCQRQKPIHRPKPAEPGESP